MVPPMPGASFDRVADHYDETRGGERRGRSHADALAPWVVGPRVVELGVGTGAIAIGLHERGVRLCGFDLSAAMLSAAQRRLGPRVAVADIDALPLADDAVDSALFVWVLQLVDDPTASLREAARVVRPGGRVLTVLAEPDHERGDEIAAIVDGLEPLRRPGRGLDPILSTAPEDLRLLHRGHTPWEAIDSSPAEQIGLIERRTYSTLFDVSDHDWRVVVEPVLDRLRALPEPGRTRRRRVRHPLVAWEVVAPGGSDE
jgi:SAM-dependent methyltransferase